MKISFLFWTLTFKFLILLLTSPNSLNIVIYCPLFWSKILFSVVFFCITWINWAATLSSFNEAKILEIISIALFFSASKASISFLKSSASLQVFIEFGSILWGILWSKTSLGKDNNSKYFKLFWISLIVLWSHPIAWFNFPL